MSRRRATDRERDLSPLERFIKEEDSRGEIARIRRRATEALAKALAERDAARPVSGAGLTSLRLVFRRAWGWARQMMAMPRTGAPRS